MRFKVGDRVVYVNRTATSCTSAIDHIGTVIKVFSNGIQVRFDDGCWVDGTDTTNPVDGLWKWRLHEELTPEQKVIRKCQDLTSRFKNKQLKTKSKPLPFPKEASHA